MCGSLVRCRSPWVVNSEWRLDLDKLRSAASDRTRSGNPDHGAAALTATAGKIIREAARRQRVIHVDRHAADIDVSGALASRDARKSGRGDPALLVVGIVWLMLGQAR